MTGSVAVDDGGTGQKICQFLRGGTIAFQKLHLIFLFGKLIRQIIGNLSAAHNHDVAERRANQIDLREKTAQGVGGRGEVDAVILPDNEMTGGDDDLVPPLHGADQNFGGKFFTQRDQRLPDEGASLFRYYLCQEDFSLGKVIQLCHGRQIDEVENLRGGIHLGIDDHGNAQILLHI